MEAVLSDDVASTGGLEQGCVLADEVLDAVFQVKLGVFSAKLVENR